MEPYPLFRKLYFALGQRSLGAVGIGNVLPELRRLAAQARRQPRREPPMLDPAYH